MALRQNILWPTLFCDIKAKGTVLGMVMFKFPIILIN